jgi:hypothetical protein
VESAFQAAQPGILAALAGGVVQALRHPVTLKELPRMADFAVTVESAAPAFGWQSGEFLAIYNARRDESAAILLDNDPVSAALEAIFAQRAAAGFDEWQGTAAELRKQIFDQTSEQDRKSKSLPATDKSLIGKLRLLAPGLRKKAVEMDLSLKQERGGEHRGKRLLKIRWSESLFSGSEAAAAGGTHGTDGRDPDYGF